jgi:hypothetical protein
VTAHGSESSKRETHLMSETVQAKKRIKPSAEEEVDLGK